MPPGEVALPQPVDVLLLGSLLKSFGDPDFEVVTTYARGVPLGVGVDLPRTPAVFPPKLKWALKEQEAFGGSASLEEEFRGATRTNYSSAVGHAEAVERVLKKQEAGGQVWALPETEARAKFGDRLQIASLSAIEKGTTDEGVETSGSSMMGRPGSG